MLFIDEQESKQEAINQEQQPSSGQEVVESSEPKKETRRTKKTDAPSEETQTAQPTQETKGKPKTVRKINARRNSQQKRGSSDGLIEKLVAIKRISKTTKGGRHMRFSVLMVVGDKKGTIGFGMGKSNEIPTAIKKAINKARNNLTRVVMTKDGTLYHDVIGKSCAGKVLLKPAKKGTGLIAGGAIRAVVELAGYKDIYTNSMGENTPINMIRAAINGLKMQKTPQQIASLRNKNIDEI